ATPSIRACPTSRLPKMATDALERITQAVLYEGYLLWPYRRSAPKNRQRWIFGGVFPEAYSLARGEDDPWRIATECPPETGDAEVAVDVRVRFLHVVDRRVAHGDAAERVFVDQLTVGGRRHLAWEEATERCIEAGGLVLGDLEQPMVLPFAVPAGSDEE